MGTGKKKKRFVIPGMFLRLVNIGFILGLLTSYLAPVISPGKIWFLAFFGLSYPFWAMMNVVFVVFWLLRRRWFVLLPLSALLLGIPTFFKHFQLKGESEYTEVQQPLRVLTYNVKHFINNNRGIPNETNSQNILAYIGSEEFDLICFQEFKSAGKNYKDIFARIKQHTGLKYFSYTNYHEYFDGKSIVAIASFSRYPIINTKKLELDKKYYCLINDIKIGKDTIRVFNIHLQSIYFNDNDLQLMQDIGDSKNRSKDIKKDSRRVLGKLHKGFQRRAEQSVKIAENIKKSPYAVLVCGDMNDTPGSFAYRQIRSDLQDAFVECGSGFGNTYAGQLPPIRIDQIFASKKLRCIHYSVRKKYYSDHFPVSSVFDLNPDIDERNDER